jgi:hypothetical protein
VPESPINPDALQKHRNYRVIFHNPNDRLPREVVASFLSLEKDGIYFDLRPVAGTMGMPVTWVKEIWETDREKAAPVIYRGEKRIY